MSNEKSTRQTRKILPFNDKLGPVPITKMDAGLILLITIFVLLVSMQAVEQTEESVPYLIMKAIHYHLSRFTLLLSTVLFGTAVYIGIFKHADVTPYFRRSVYVMVGTMTFQALVGFFMYFIVGTRPFDEIHLIYGTATVAALPFFIFVEVTAEKRPSMGSYMWGFAILAGIIIRSISTGAA